MQTAENKQRDSFLIAEFRDFFGSASHFRTPAFRSRSVCSPFLATCHSPLATAFLIGTPMLSRFCASHTKQRLGVLSNRDRFQLCCTGQKNSNRQTYGLLEMSVSC